MENGMITFKLTFMANTVDKSIPENLNHVQLYHRVQFKKNSSDLFNELYECSAHLFKSKVVHPDDIFILRYADEDGDICAITSNTELVEALRQYPKLLKILVTTVRVFEPQTPPDLSDSNESIISSSASLVKSNDSLKAVEGSYDHELAKSNAELNDDDSDFVKLNHSDLNTPPFVRVGTPSVEIDVLDETDVESEESKLTPTEMKDFRLNPLTVNVNNTDFPYSKEPTAASSPAVPATFESIASKAPPIPKVDLTTSISSLITTPMDFDNASDRFDAPKTHLSVARDEPLQEPSSCLLSNNAALNAANFKHISQQPSSPTINRDATATSQVSRLHSSSSRRRNSFFCRKCCAKIDGVLYRCVECSHYNLCESCEAKSDHPQLHPLIKVRDVANAHAHLRHAKNDALSFLRNYQFEYPSTGIDYSQPRVSGCPPTPKLNASIVDSDCLDHLTVKIGENVTKSWTILNSGQVAWPCRTQLRFIGGTIALASDADNEQVAIDVPSLQPGEKVHLSVLILVNNEVGTYHGSFGFYTPEGICFGQDCPVEVTVEDPQSDSVEIPQSLPKFENPIPKPNPISPSVRHPMNSSLPNTSVPVDMSSKVSANSPQPKPIVYTPLDSNTSIARVYPIIPPQPSSSILSAPISISSDPVPTVQTPANEYNMYRHELVQLIQMGFDADICRYMIIQSKGDVNAAVNAILRN